MVSHGFKIVNMMNFILQSQEMFNKMGRYHSDFNEIINMYLQFLQDLDYYNIFMKKSIKILLQDDKIRKMSKKDLLEEMQDSSEIQETKHAYLYINEAQKISDRLYEFYHNRYYYKTIRQIISFPSFLII